MRLAGAVAGTLLVLVSAFNSPPDAGDAIFALALFTMIGGWVLGGWRRSDSPKVSVAGETLLGVGIGAGIGLALLFIIPMIGWVVTGRVM